MFSSTNCRLVGGARGAAAVCVAGSMVVAAHATPPRPPADGDAHTPTHEAWPKADGATTPINDRPVFAALFGQPDGALADVTLTRTLQGGALWIDGEVVTGTADHAGDVDAAGLQLGKPTATGALVLYRADGTPAWAIGPQADPYQASDVVQNHALQLQPAPAALVPNGVDADPGPTPAEAEAGRLLAAIEADASSETVRAALAFIGGERRASENHLADRVGDALLASPPTVRRVADHLADPHLRVRVAAATLLPRSLPRDRWPNVPDGFLPEADRRAAAAAWRSALTPPGGRDDAPQRSDTAP